MSNIYKKRLSKISKGVLFLLILTITFIYGCRLLTLDTPSVKPPITQTMDLTVYYLKDSENDIYLVREIHTVEKNPAVAKAALNELISGNPITNGAYRVLPANTKILGISIVQGLATVDFSNEVLMANVGARGEAMGIVSIVNTLTEFPTIQKVQFTVDGKAENGMDWWGHIGLYDQPFKRNLNSVVEPTP